MANYYEILEVERNATDKEIKSAYRKLAKKWHPDTTQFDKEYAASKFKEVTNAYNVLSDAETRKQYDYNLDYEVRRREENRRREQARREAEARRREQERQEAARRRQEQARQEAERRRQEQSWQEAELRRQEMARQEAECRRQEQERILEEERRQQERERQEAERRRQEQSWQEAEYRRQAQARQEAEHSRQERQEAERHRQEQERQEAERRQRQQKRKNVGNTNFTKETIEKIYSLREKALIKIVKLLFMFKLRPTWYNGLMLFVLPWLVICINIEYNIYSTLFSKLDYEIYLYTGIDFMGGFTYYIIKTILSIYILFVPGLNIFNLISLDDDGKNIFDDYEICKISSLFFLFMLSIAIIALWWDGVL